MSRLCSDSGGAMEAGVGVRGQRQRLTCSVLVRLAGRVRPLGRALVLLGIGAAVGVHQPLLAWEGSGGQRSKVKGHPPATQECVRV